MRILVLEIQFEELRMRACVKEGRRGKEGRHTKLGRVVIEKVKEECMSEDRKKKAQTMSFHEFHRLLGDK
jgi:hypothetical protein